ncbi:DUF6660 family protein [Chryseobacterium sp. CT-SW4]|uniref:DUF6660 family protein n=1 Tax=Chryseobacterium sp. SW-1 TaxID=3157343 RepID=UPI003B029439
MEDLLKHFKKCYLCTMNLLRLIFAFYFMALSITPCADTYPQPENSRNALTSINIRASHLKDSADICSPLCSCNCCQMTVTAFKMDPLWEFPAEIKTYFSKKILFHKNDLSYQIYNHIWQPPKI